MQHRLRVAGWALDGALRRRRRRPDAVDGDVAAVMAAKREIALAGVEVCDLAMELAGGAAYFKGSPIERAYRDIRAAKLHPFTPEATLLHAGRLALGLPCDDDLTVTPGAVRLTAPGLGAGPSRMTSQTPGS